MIKRFFSSNRNIKKSIAFIGGGNMTNAMVGGLIKSKIYNNSEIIVSDKNENKNKILNEKWKIKTIQNNYNAVDNSDIIVLAVKPHSLDSVFNDISGIENKLIISVVAGVPLEIYKHHLKNNKIVRVMPNTPCMIQKGISTWITNDLDDIEKNKIKKILQSFGEEVFVENENIIDISTAVSGSGPIYTYMLVESMIDASVHLGLHRDKAEKFVHQTVLGSIEYLIDSKCHPTILKNNITSPGGTTANSLNILEKKGFRNTISDAIWSGYDRSIEIKNNFVKK